MVSSIACHTSIIGAQGDQSVAEDKVLVSLPSESTPETIPASRCSLGAVDNSGPVRVHPTRVAEKLEGSVVGSTHPVVANRWGNACSYLVSLPSA